MTCLKLHDPFQASRKEKGKYDKLAQEDETTKKDCELGFQRASVLSASSVDFGLEAAELAFPDGGLAVESSLRLCITERPGPHLLVHACTKSEGAPPLNYAVHHMAVSKNFGGPVSRCP